MGARILYATIVLSTLVLAAAAFIWISDHSDGAGTLALDAVVIFLVGSVVATVVQVLGEDKRP